MLVTKAELSQLIIVIYASERRADAPSRAVVEAWHPQLAGYPVEDALQVVSQHYADSDRPITLANLCEGLRKAEKARRPTNRVEDSLLIPDADPDDPQAFISAMREQRYFARRDPADFAPRELDLPAMGDVPEQEVKPPRPRRWWMLRGKGQDGPEGA
jgi:hypothetical protein